MLHDDSLLTTDKRKPNLHFRSSQANSLMIFRQPGCLGPARLLTVPRRGTANLDAPAPPDDAADLIRLAPTIQSVLLVDLMDPVPRSDVTALLALNEDQARGSIESRFARLRPEMRIHEAIIGQALCPEYVCSAWDVYDCQA